MKNDICYQHLYWISEDSYKQRRIVSAANRITLIDGVTKIVIPCVRHYSKEHGEILRLLENLGALTQKGFAYGDDQGFIDQYSNYWTREEAMIIAKAAGQVDIERKDEIPDTLFSEDLY